jgi:hypothetical protein
MEMNAVRSIAFTGKCNEADARRWLLETRIQSVGGKGSKRYLWNEQSVAKAIEYVLYGQGDELPDFE